MIKVADFGLAVEEECSKGYFRQNKSDTVKLPFRWMAPESLRDGVFTERTDVVSKIAMRRGRSFYLRFLGRQKFGIHNMYDCTQLCCMYYNIANQERKYFCMRFSCLHIYEVGQ